MRTAVLISGQMRTFKRCYPTMKWQVFRHYDDLHFFVCVEEDLNMDSAYLLAQDYVNVHIGTYPTPTDLPEIAHELGEHAPYSNSVTHRQIMGQLDGLQQTWKFLSNTYRPYDFDSIIRMRTDLWFHRFVKPPQPKTLQAYLPWWGKFGGVNDRFAVMSPYAAQAYFNARSRVDELLAKGCPFHHESIMAEALKLDQITVSNLMTEFGRLRTNGDFRWPEINLIDVAGLI